MSEPAESLVRRKIERPFGVHFITALDFIRLGLSPLIGFFLILRNPEVRVSPDGLFLTVVFAAMILSASIWAWTGDDFGRWLLLLLVTIRTLLLIANAVTLLLTLNDADRAQAANPVFAAIGGTIWTGIHWWYFNRRETIAYYKQRSLTERA